MIVAIIPMNRNRVETLDVNPANFNVKMAIALAQFKFAMVQMIASIIRTKMKIANDSFALISISNAAHQQIARHFVLTTSNAVMALT